MIIYLTQHFARKVLGARRILIRRDATIPEALTNRLFCFCFVLHRMGFFVPRKSLRAR